MKDLDLVKATAKSAVRECDSHRGRIERGKALLASTFPLTIEEFSTLSEESIQGIDQFIYRFMKLQDSIGTRLLPSLYSLLEADPAPVPFLDQLNRLEKTGVISSARTWQVFRNLRNNLAHDYPESAEQTVETLNLLFGTIDELLGFYEALRATAETRGFLA